MAVVSIVNRSRLFRVKVSVLNHLKIGIQHIQYSFFLATCLPVSRAESQTKELLKFNKPGHGVCVNAEPIQGFTDCEGICSSGSKYNSLTDVHEKFCTCCSIKSYQPISVKMICADGHTYTQRVSFSYLTNYTQSD